MMKKAYIIPIVFMLLCTAFVFPATASSGLQIQTNTPEAYKDMPLPITVTQNGTVISGASVQFVLNNGIPIYAKTNEYGIARFKPLLTGTLTITAEKNGLTATKTMIVSGAIPQETVSVTNQTNTSINITAPSFTTNMTVEFSENITGNLTSEAGTIEQMADKTSNSTGVYLNLKTMLRDLGLTNATNDDVDVHTAASIRLTTDIDENKVCGLWINFTVLIDWWINLGKNKSKIVIVKIDDATGNIKDINTEDNITIIENSADNTVTFSTWFSGFSIYTLLGYTPKPLSVSVSANPSSVSPGGTSMITVTASSNGLPVSDRTVNLSTTGGSISPSTGYTNANGKMTTTYTAPSSAGTYTIHAMVSKSGYLSETGQCDIIVKSDRGNGEDGISWITVTLESGTFNVKTKKTEFSSGNTYPVNRRTALGALDASGVSYTVIDKDENIDWWRTWETLYVDSIRGKEHKLLEGKGWMYWVNYPDNPQPSNGSNVYPVKDGNKVYWYWSEGMGTTPGSNPSDVYIKVRVPPGSGGPPNGEDDDPTPTPTPTQIVNETKPIEPIEAGENASVTFEKTDITRIIINANNTIRNAEVTIQQIEKPENITNVSGIPYCYFNITTTNLTAADITNATIEFKVNKTWLNESNVDETTIKLNRYSDINNNWGALPTSKVEEDNASLYFESETPGFSLFAISGEGKTARMTTEAGAEIEKETPIPEVTAPPTPTSTPTPIPAPAPVPRIPMSLILIVIAVIVIAGVIIAVQRRKK